MREFTYLWKRETVLRQVGARLNHASGEQLRHVGQGDRLWIVAAYANRLFLAGPLVIGRTMNAAQARHVYGPDLWKSRYHVGSAPGTIVRVGHVDITRHASHLRFLGDRPALQENASTWAMALRNVRQLVPQSAALLARLWGRGTGRRVPAAMAPAESRALEGLKTETVRYSRKRSGRLRNEALHQARGVCAACSLRYAGYLDGLGERVLQVHHRKQLASTDVPRLTRATDLAVLCANCHALVHADPRRALGVEKLRAMIRAARNRPLQPVSRTVLRAARPAIHGRRTSA